MKLIDVPNQSAGNVFDFIVIIDEIQPEVIIMTKKGDELRKKDIVVKDEDAKTTFALWGEKIDEFSFYKN